MRARFVPCLLILCATVFGQEELIGSGRFPETRGVSGLPGGGFGVLPSGRPAFRGAMALSTPIAYGLDRWHWAAGLGTTSPDRNLRGLDTDLSSNVSAGTGYLMAGIPTRYGSLTYSLMFISVHLDETTTNLLFTPRQRGAVTWAAGVQDLYDSSGTTRPYERRSAISPFVVATGSPAPDLYASVGYGNQRFGGVFGNVSYNLGSSVKVLAEYDTYNWNYGTAFRLGDFTGPNGRRVEATAFLGLIRGKYATWNFSLSL